MFMQSTVVWLFISLLFSCSKSSVKDYPNRTDSESTEEQKVKKNDTDTSCQTLSLHGGTCATSKDFPSTFFIGNCTATKIGPQHILTAAHCVINKGEHTVSLKSGSDIKIYRSRHIDKKTQPDIVVK